MAGSDWSGPLHETPPEQTEAWQNSGPEEDSADSGEQSFADLLVDVNLAEIDRDVVEYSGIEAALLRLAEGRYGLRVRCEESIDSQRLDRNPAAARCLKCQQPFEQSEWKTHNRTRWETSVRFGAAAIQSSHEPADYVHVQSVKFSKQVRFSTNAVRPTVNNNATSTYCRSHICSRSWVYGCVFCDTRNSS